MDYISNDNFDNDNNGQIDEMIYEQTSVLFPGFVVTANGILEKRSGKMIDDVSIHFLGLSTRACNAICRWGITCCITVDDTVMLSSLFLLNKDDIIRFSKKTWDEIYTTVEAYLLGNGEFGKAETPESTKRICQEKCSQKTHKKLKEAILVGWTLSGTKLVHIKSGEVISDAPVSALRLNFRAINGLTEAGIQKISDFIGVSCEDLLEVRNVGVGTIDTIIEKLKQYVSNPAEEEICPIAQTFEVSNTTSEKNASEENAFIEEFIILPLDPNVSILAEEYALVNGRIFRRSDYAQVADAPIVALNLSLRAANCLKFYGIVKISQLVGMPFEDFRSIRNLGVKATNEIIEKLDFYLGSRVIAGESTKIKVLPTDKILDYFNEYPFAEFSREETLKLFGDDQDGVFSAIDILLENGTLVFENGLYRKHYLSFYQVLETLLESANESNQRCANVLLMRSRGSTLEEVGHSMNLTRERIRQMEKKIFRGIIKIHNGLFAEDQLAYLVENYSVSSELLLSLVNGNHQVLYYLSSRYVGGNRDLTEALDDKKLPIELRRKIEKWICKDYLFIDGRYVPARRGDIEDCVLEKCCKDEVSLDEFFDLYSRFLEEHSIIDERLQVTETTRMTRVNQLSASMKLLWKQNQRIRYYDIEGGEYDELLEVLNLEQYSDVEISTRKFILDYPDLMERYDIRDEYELHNLLKKIKADQTVAGMQFGRMPTILFGEFDRDDFVKKMLFANAPIRGEELAGKISAELGFRSDTVYSGWFNCISEYFRHGIYSVDYEKMPEDHMSVLKTALTDDFYYINEVLKIYKSVVDAADEKFLNPYNLKRMGFVVADTYIVQNYPTADAYFEHLLTFNDITDVAPISKRYSVLIRTCLAHLKDDLDMIEFEPYQYINIRKLEKLGITKEKLVGYRNCVWSFLSDDEFFSIKSLVGDGFDHELHSLGFMDLFYASILKSDKRFAWQRVGGAVIFNPRNEQFSVHYFLVHYINNVKSINIDDLVEELREKYGIELERSDVVQKVKGSLIYYDSIMETLYDSYETYYEEI